MNPRFERIMLRVATIPEGRVVQNPVQSLNEPELTLSAGLRIISPPRQGLSSLTV